MKINKKSEAGQNIIHTAMLLLAAFVWGMAFPFQRIGAGYVGGWTFLAARSWLSVAVMYPVVHWLEHRKGRRAEDGRIADCSHEAGEDAAGSETGARHASRWKEWKPGILCGIFLCFASGLQQIGIAGTSTAKSGFITALYVVLVPILSWLFLRKKQSGKIWLAIVLCVAGLYLLCLAGGSGSAAGSGGFSAGDLLTLACALLFAIQIILVDRYVSEVGALRLTYDQFVTEAVLATILMFLVEKPSLQGIRMAWVPIAYAGIMSSAVGYSLQAEGQKGLNPAVASLAMCMESVFSAIGGWLLLHESLTGSEAAGCALMFAAILLTELPVEKLFHRPRHHTADSSG